jgi:hypothetical protein
VSQGGKTLLLRLPQAEQASVQVYSGSTSPISGWVSRRYDDRRPAPTIAWRARLKGEIVLHTQITC